MKAQNLSAPVVVIPAYEPGGSLVSLVERLSETPCRRILVVNDGSSAKCAPIFERLRAFSNVEIVTHAVNLGKGQALKTAFNHFLVRYPDSVGLITADADGQHLPEDIAKIETDLLSNPSALCVGARQFDKDVPLRSAFGNHTTRWVFRFFVGRMLTDTQSGLRGIPRGFMPELLRVTSMGYDFELEMLVRAVRRKMAIRETPIQTVYIDQNRDSHFNPILDSLKIYFVFLRFSSVSLASALLDFLLFGLFQFFTGKIFGSLVAARIASATFNFTLGRSLVFKSKGRMASEVLKYSTLAIALMLLSYTLIRAQVMLLGMNVYVAKVCAEVFLFMVSFAVQDLWVFSGGESEEGSEAAVPEAVLPPQA